MQYQITDVPGIVEVLAVIGLLTFSFCHVRFLNDLGTGKRGAIECWEVGDAKGGPHFVIQENELLIHTAISVFGAMLSAL